MLFQRAQKCDDHPALFFGVKQAAGRMAITIGCDFIEQLAICVGLHDFTRQVRGLSVLWFIEKTIAFAFRSVANLAAISIKILSPLDDVGRDLERGF